MIPSPLALTTEQFSITITAIGDVKKDFLLVSVATLLRCYPLRDLMNSGEYSKFKK